MSAVLHRLANGIVVAVDPMPGAQSAAVGLYASVGARSEPDALGGLAHLVEHMVFKGAGGRDARAIAEAIEDVGGSLNAWTARDQTVFHARVLGADVPLAMELIADLVRAPVLDAAELEREKQVILSELGEALDAPDDLIHDHLFEACYGRQPLARPVLGREPTIRAASAADCRAWLANEFRPDRLVIAASGAVHPDAVLQLAERLFGDLMAGSAPPGATATFSGGARHDRRAYEQAHWAFAFPGVAAADPTGPALGLFTQAVGGGMSSRLFQQLREDRGLAYSIYAWAQGFADTGLFAVNCATDRGKAAEAMSLARDVVSRAAEDLSEAELNRARAQIEAGLLMTLETVQGRADQMARSIEVFGRILTPDELVTELRSVVAQVRDGALGAGGGAGAPRGAGRDRLDRQPPRPGGVMADPLPLATLVAEPWADFGLIDSGHGRKYERYGPIRVVRPEPQAMWATASADWDPDATFVPGSDEEGGGRWVQHRAVPRDWPLARDGVRFHASLTPFRHLGFFPDMAAQWDWMRARSSDADVLNLFGYTGVGTLLLSEAGGRMVHVDASKKSVEGGRANAVLSGMAERPIRWIVDDAAKFAAREVRRGRRYDGILLDPPKFGRGPEGELWRLEEHLPFLLADCRRLLDEHSRYLVLTAYAVRMSALAIGELLRQATAGLGGRLECGEMAVREEARGLLLPTAIFARWSSD